MNNKTAKLLRKKMLKLNGEIGFKKKFRLFKKNTFNSIHLRKLS